MIESGERERYIYIYIVDGASFVLLQYFFRGRQIIFWGGRSCAVCRARCTGLRGGLCSQSASSCAAREALKPLARKAARTSSLFLRSTFSFMHSSWAGPGIASVLALWLFGSDGCWVWSLSRLRNRCRDGSPS